jgi:hypothetical protein
MDRTEGPLRSLPDWDAPEGAGAGLGTAATAAVWALLAGLGWVVVDVLGGPRPVGALVVVAALGTDMYTVGRRAVRGRGARPIAPGSSPRLENVFAGAVARAGLGDVRLLTFSATAPEAFVCDSGGPAVAVSEGLAEDFSRTELEAVLVHCLLRIRSHNLWRSRLACHLRWLAGFAGTVVGAHEDVAATALTRYPPALAAAIRKSAVDSGSLAPLAFVAEHPCHAPVGARLDLLADL